VTVTDAEVEALVGKRPDSTDDWEARRPALVDWLKNRLGKSLAPQEDWSATDEEIATDGCRQMSVRRGRAKAGAFIVPAGHVGRGPAVIYFANSLSVQRNAGADGSITAARLAAEDLARAGYVVLLAYQPSLEKEATPKAGAAEPATWQATAHWDFEAAGFLLGRREVDPDRVAVLGLGEAARRAWWVAALDQRLAAVVSLGTPEAATLEDQVLLSLIAARPHRLALDTKQVRSREAAYQHWIAGPQSIYERYDLSSLFSAKLGVGFHATPESPAWHDTLSWLKHEL
jgi:dienelactone hydrolase